MSPFEKFMGHEPGILTLDCHRHAVRFNSTACHKFKLYEWAHVELYFDHERRIIAFGRVPNGTIASRKVSIGVGNTQATVGCKAFFHHIGITETVRLPVELDEETGYLVAVLPEETNRGD